MAILASEIMDRAKRIIQDETSVRWPLAELRMWVNDALREIVLQKPTAHSKTIIITLQAGTYQTVPANVIALLRVVRNLKTTSETVRQGLRAIRMVSREVLDSQHPDWHDGTIIVASKIVKHVVFDQTDPKSFYVFPGNDGTGIVEAVVATSPTPVALPADPENIALYNIALDIDDIYGGAVLDYVLYRAYSKDAQFAGNAQRAAAHYQTFANTLGLKVQVEAVANPNVTPQNETAV